MLVPAGAEGGGEVAVAGAVDLLDPGAEAGQGFLAFGPVEFPPPRRWDRLVFLAAGVVAFGCRDGSEPGGEGANLLVEAIKGVQQG